MKLQNSYIFLDNPNNPTTKEPQSKDENIIKIDIPRSVYSYLKKTFPCISTANTPDWFYCKYLSWIYNENNNPCTVHFHIEEVVDATYLDVMVEGKSKNQLVTCLEHIQKALQNSGVQSDYIMIISYDAISEYYCNKIYPKLNNVERNMRKLLFNIYIVNLGREYYKATVSDDLQSKIKSVIKPKGNQKQKEITVIQEFFYSFEFNDIQNLLFVPKWTSIDEDTKKDFLERNKDLASLSDDTLRAAFVSLEPKSDWDRFFSSKITDVDFKDILNTFRIHRNAVAHCKFFNRDSYHDCNKAISRLNKAILLAIQLTEEEDFVKKNDIALRESFASIKNAFTEYSVKLSAVINEIMQSMFSPISQALKELTSSIYSAYQIPPIKICTPPPETAETDPEDDTST